MNQASLETAGAGVNLVTFGEAVKAMKEGKRAQRLNWNGKGLFVFMQVPSVVDVETIVPVMSSLPKAVKEHLLDKYDLSESEDHKTIRYSNQYAIVYPNNEIYGWSPSGTDSLAEDWIILD